MIAREADRFDHHRGSQPLLRAGRPLRWGVSLLVNLAAYVAVCAFWRYLTTGQWFDFALSAYRADLSTPVGQILVEPLSVFRYPWMVVVAGALLAMVIYVPIAVAVLYRLPTALPFVVTIALVGHAPFLAATIAVGGLLAARTTLRSDMPFLANVLGLAPVTVYLALAYLGVSARGTLPLQRWILMSPFVTAIALAVLAGWPVLGLARWMDFRPGAVWPVLVVLLALPMVVFYTKIGPAELEYAVLAGEIPPGDSLLQAESLRVWSQRNYAAHLPEARLEEEVRKDMDRRRADLRGRAEAYYRRFPRGPRAPEALWLAAECLSLQLDSKALARDQIRYVSDCVPATPEARAAWQRLRDEAGRGDHVYLASWHLGELALRAGKIDQAERHLASARAGLLQVVGALAAKEEARAQGGAFLPRRRLPSDRQWREALFQVDRLIWLMIENADAPEALAALLALDPHRRDYASALAEVARTYQQTSLGDNLAVAVALTVENRYERAERLVPLARAGPVVDAAIEAHYELGCLASLTKEYPVLQLVEGLQTPRWYFTQVVAARENPWQRRAQERLDWLRAIGRGRPDADTAEGEYELLTGSLDDPLDLFKPVILEEWAKANAAAGLSPSALERRVRIDLQRRREELLRKGLTFLSRFPKNPRGASVAWLCARAHSLTIDAAALQEGLVRYTTDHVRDTTACRNAWHRLVRDHARAPQSALAQWHLGELALRDRRFDEARTLLTASEQRLRKIVAAGAGPGTAESDRPTIDQYRRAVHAVRRLLWLMEENATALDALADYLATDPHEANYFDRLCALARGYEQTAFGDNLKLAVAMAQDDLPRRAEALALLARTEPPTDAGIEALYELGRLALSTVEAPSPTPIEALRDSTSYFQRVRSARVNPWQALAGEHLRAISATTRPLGPSAHGEEAFAELLRTLESPRTIYRPIILTVWARRMGLDHLSEVKLRSRARADLETRRREFAQHCRDFLDRYPRSLYAPKVLYLAATMLSVQLDEPALHVDVGLIKYRADHLRDTLDVRRTWRALVRDYPQSRQAALGWWHLAVLALRHEQWQEAREHLARARGALARALRSLPVDAPRPAVAAILPNDPVPDVTAYRDAQFAARRLAWLIEANRVASDPRAAAALAALLDANPCTTHYAEQLERLARAHAKTPLADNIKLALALTVRDPARRAAELLALARDAQGTDGAVEACWHLARLGLRAIEQDQLPAVAGFRQPEYYLQRVADAPGNPWQQEAADHLRRLQPTTRPKGTS